MTEEQSLFITAPYAIYADLNLSGNAKWILVEILNLLKVNRRWCWASNGHFAKTFGIKKANVSYHIKQLEKEGWIKTQPVKNCKLENCQLKERGWHRHIYPLDPLSNILESLSSKTGYPIKSVGTINKTLNKTYNNNSVVDKKKKYKSVHMWISRNYGKTEICQKCETKSNIQWANISGNYLRDISDWVQLCRKHHLEYDMARRRKFRFKGLSNKDIAKKYFPLKKGDKLLIKITSWAYERASTRPSCTESSFKRSVKRAIDKHGLEFVNKVFSNETNAIQFLKNIK